MVMGHGLPRVELTAQERETFQGWVRRSTTAQGLAQRARIVLECADGRINIEVADRLGVSRPTVGKWRSRFLVHRLDGLLDEPRPGRPRAVDDREVERVLTKTLESTPKDATHWSTRSLATEVGLKRWLLRRPRFHLHFTPTYSSWLNLVERWFAALTEKRLRRSAHRSVPRLEADLAEWIRLHNQDPKPFRWTKTADEILGSLRRFCERTSGTGH